MLTTHKPHVEIIHRAGLAVTTTRQYIRALDNLITARVDPRNTDELSRYAADLSQSERAFLKSALRIMFTDEIHRAKAAANPENVNQVQAYLWNIDAMLDTIQTNKSKGTKAHLWLSREQVEQITSLPDRSTVSGRRDWVVLGLLFGAGLRRDELVNLEFTHIRHQPTKNGQRRAVLEVTGKGSKPRVIPINAHLEARLMEWREETGEGFIARAVNKAGSINGSLSGKSVHTIVQTYGAQINLPELAPHDARRTYAQIGLNSGVSIVQISTLLGHADLATTQKYLDLHVDIEQSISDYIPLS